MELLGYKLQPADDSRTPDVALFFCSEGYVCLTHQQGTKSLALLFLFDHSFPDLPGNTVVLCACEGDEWLNGSMAQRLRGSMDQ